MKLKRILLEQIYDKVDSKWDYRVVNNKWQTAKKGTNGWVSLDKFPEAIKKLDNKYPDARIKTTTAKAPKSKVISTNPKPAAKSNTTQVSSKPYPYGNLESKPSDAFIAKIIKQANGGYFGNDKEAWVEAAVNAIPNLESYENVSKLLGKDVLSYVLSFMSQKEINSRQHTGPTIQKRINWLKKYNSIKSNLENKGISEIGIKQLEYAYTTGLVKGVSFLLISKRYNLLYLFDSNFNLVYTGQIIDGANYSEDIAPELEFRGKTYPEWREYSRDYWEGTGFYKDNKVAQQVAKAEGTGHGHGKKSYEKWKNAYTAAKKKGDYWFIADKPFIDGSGKTHNVGDKVWQPISYTASTFHPGNHKWTPAGIHALGGTSSGAAEDHRAGYEDVKGFVEKGGTNAWGLMSIDGKVSYTQWIHGTVKSRIPLFKQLQRKVDIDNANGVQTVPSSYTDWMEKEINTYAKGKNSPAGASSGCMNVRAVTVEKIREYNPRIVLVLSNKEDKISELPYGTFETVLGKLDKDPVDYPMNSVKNVLYKIGDIFSSE